MSQCGSQNTLHLLRTQTGAVRVKAAVGKAVRVKHDLDLSTIHAVSTSRRTPACAMMNRRGSRPESRLNPARGRTARSPANRRRRKSRGWCRRCYRLGATFRIGISNSRQLYAERPELIESPQDGLFTSWYLRFQIAKAIQKHVAYLRNCASTQPSLTGGFVY